MERNYIGENIRRYRERSKITQQELADKVGVTWEMISRYERSASSPLKKLNKLANALGVTQSQLLEEHVPEVANFSNIRVPLFTKIPSPPRFISTQTNYFYSCPEWIYNLDPEVIAVDSSLARSNIKDLSLNGVLFISIEIEPKKGDIIVSKNYDTLIVEYFQGNNRNILGKLIAQELRY
jgi:transcriptional regulator with XRE-family HTH domain